MTQHRFALLLGALALLTTGPAHAQQTLTVIESTPGFFDLPMRNAIADFAPALHLNVKVITINGGGALATEFQGGTGDIAFVGADTPLRLAQANAVPGGITILGTNMTNMLYALISKAGSPYHSLESTQGSERRHHRRRRRERSRVEMGAQDQGTYAVQRHPHGRPRLPAHDLARRDQRKRRRRHSLQPGPR